MRERLITRHPKAKPEDDHFMLDRWTPPAMHMTTPMVRDVVQHGQVVDRIYRSVCLCGWRSLEYHAPTVDRCPVGQALTEREQRRQKDRLVWRPASVVE